MTTAATLSDAHNWLDSTPFVSEQVRPSRFPIFREQHHVVREPNTGPKLTEQELVPLTFREYLDYFLSHPAFAGPRRYLLSDEQYTHLLKIQVTDKKVVEFLEANELDKEWSSWLWHAMGADTYSYWMMEYRGKTAMDIDKGPVLVCFKDPAGAAGREGSKFVRRPSKSSSPLTIGGVRRCVPFSQIEIVLDYCHTGALGKSIHHGMDTTYKRCLREFDGISRDMCRVYVAKCPICQLRWQCSTTRRRAYTGSICSMRWPCLWRVSSRAAVQ